MNRSNRRPSASCAATHSSSAKRVEPVRGEDHGRAARRTDRLHRARGTRRCRTRAPGFVGDERAGHEAGSAARTRGGPQDARAGVGIEELHVAGVHVHRGDESGLDRACDERLEPGPVDRTVGGERQQHRRHPEDRAMTQRRARRSCRILPGDERVEPVDECGCGGAVHARAQPRRHRGMRPPRTPASAHRPAPSSRARARWCAAT